METNEALPLLACKNIVVRMPNWLGDFCMALPLLSDLRRSIPEAKISAICSEPLGQLLDYDPNVNEIIQFKRPNGWIHRAVRFDIVDRLKKGNYDLGLLMTNSFSSAWWFWRAGVKNRVGYAGNGRTLLLNYPIYYPKDKEKRHLIELYKLLLSPIGIPLSKTLPKLYISQEEKKKRDELFEKVGVTSADILLGINPGAAYGSAKCWPPERFHQLVRKLIDTTDLKVLLFGDLKGKETVSMICRGLPADRVIDLAAKTSIRELIACIDGCDLFSTNDSGPMHVSSALGVPLVALFGSTSDQSTGPYRGEKVMHKHVPCSPCYRKECPIDFRCMKKIEVEEVYQELMLLLKVVQGQVLKKCDADGSYTQLS